MKRHRFFILLYSLWILVCIRFSKATLVLPLDLDALTREADVIVAGRIGEIREEGSTTLEIADTSVAARQMRAQLEVERMIHGQVPTGDIFFRFALPDAPIGYQGIRRGQFGVFFLRKVAQGYEVMDPYYPFVVTAPGAAAGTGNYVDQVTTEVTHTFDSSTATSDERLQAVVVLRTLQTALAARGLKSAASGPDLRARAWALASLLARNDITLLDSAIELMLSGDPRIDQDLKNVVAFGLRDGVRDPRAVSALTRLLVAKDVTLRRSAAAALRSTHDTTAIEPLKQALFDSDQQVRYLAVAGLGEITGQDDWTPSVDYFRQNEARFLGHWREWSKLQK